MTFETISRGPPCCADLGDTDAGGSVAGWRGTRLNYLLIAGLAVTLLLYIVPSTTHRFS